MSVFFDRADAGRALAARLQDYAGRGDILVLALPRGGVPVAYEIAQALRLPLDVLIVRKLGAPGQPELAMGAIAAGGVVVLNAEVAGWFADDKEKIEDVIARERNELERREHAYRHGLSSLAVDGKTVIVVDDGAATGATMRAAIQVLHSLHAMRIVVALPVASREACAELRQVVDDVLCLHTPMSFTSVGQWYEVFDQTSDREVIELLRHAKARQ